MRLSTLLVLMALSGSVSAAAKPYVLKCTSSDGEPTADLTVDLDNMLMTWGWPRPNYIITKVKDRYITAIRDERVISSEAGGEIYVLDRVTGAYKIASIGMYCNNDSCQTGTHLGMGTYFGVCKKPMF